MRIINSVSNVTAFNKMINGLFVIGTNKFNADNAEGFKYYILPEESGCAIKALKKHVFLQVGEFEKILVLTEEGMLCKTIEAGFNLYSSVKIRNELFIRNRETKSYWILGDDMQFKDLGLNFRFTSYVNDTFYSEISNVIERIRPEPYWQQDISTYGVNFNAGDEPTPNEIDGQLMGYENLLFVPLRGGQLLALDAHTGEKVWMLEQEIGGQYDIFKDKVYKKNKFLYEIEAKNGDMLRQINIEDNSLQKEFMALGPIWAYEDVIVLVNILNGEIVMLNRKDFSVYDKVNIGERMAHSKDNIIWHENKLYVLDLNSTLHIFEKE